MIAAEATGLWMPQLSSKQPGLVADGITWDCDSIWAEHVQLRRLYNASLLWSGDWPHTYGHNDYWVTVAGYTYPDAEGARRWCQDHGRDVPEHCYPTQIR
jgi:serine/threonine kinase PknH